MKCAVSGAVIPPDSVPIIMPDKAGIWVQIDDKGRAAVYEVLFHPTESGSFVARMLNAIGDDPTTGRFYPLKLLRAEGWRWLP